MIHRHRGISNRAVVINLISVVLLALLYFAVFTNRQTQPSNGTPSPQQLQAAEPAAQAEAESNSLANAMTQANSPDEDQASEQSAEQPEGGEPTSQVEARATPERPANAEAEQDLEDPLVGSDQASAEDYTVARGDTLASIARAYDTTIPALVEANALANPHRLSIGQVLTLPEGLGEESPPEQADSSSKGSSLLGQPQPLNK